MRGIKAVILLAAYVLLTWALINVAQLALAIYPQYALWHLGAILAILYTGADLFDRQREWFGWRTDGRRRRTYAPWRRYE